MRPVRRAPALVGLQGPCDNLSHADVPACLEPVQRARSIQVEGDANKRLAIGPFAFALTSSIVHELSNTLVAGPRNSQSCGGFAQAPMELRYWRRGVVQSNDGLQESSIESGCHRVHSPETARSEVVPELQEHRSSLQVATCHKARLFSRGDSHARQRVSREVEARSTKSASTSLNAGWRWTTWPYPGKTARSAERSRSRTSQIVSKAS